MDWLSVLKKGWCFSVAATAVTQLFHYFAHYFFTSWNYLDFISNAWVSMDSAKFNNCIHIILDFEEKITTEVGAAWAAKIAKRQEFRQKIVARKFLWHYLENVEINLNEHVESFSQHFDEFEYQLKINELCNRPVDPSRPPWKIYVFPNIANRGGSMFVKIHHALGDGFNTGRYLVSLCEKRPEPVVERKKRRKEPTNIFSEVGSYFSTLGQSLADKPDPASLFRSTAPIQKSNCTCLSRKLTSTVEEVKSLGKKMGATINDVILAGFSAAAMEYNDKYAPDEPRHDLTTCVWVSTVPIAKAFDPVTNENPLQFGNGNLSMVNLQLPTTTKPARHLDHVTEVNKRIGLLKNSKMPAIGLGLLNFIGMLPQFIFELIWDEIGKPSWSLSNVRGPQEKIIIEGHVVKMIYFFVPPSSGQRLGQFATLISYDNHFGLSLSSAAHSRGFTFETLTEFFDIYDKNITKFVKEGSVTTKGIYEEEH